jgi:hypothetical protein
LKREEKKICSGIRFNNDLVKDKFGQTIITNLMWEGEKHKRNFELMVMPQSRVEEHRPDALSCVMLASSRGSVSGRSTHMRRITAIGNASRVEKDVKPKDSFFNPAFSFVLQATLSCHPATRDDTLVVPLNLKVYSPRTQL